MSVFIMMNKPKGCISAKYDERRRTVCELLPSDITEKVHPIGRLDGDTEGLLLFTDDGRYDYALLMPEFHIEKCYFFYALGSLTAEKIHMLENGLMLPHDGKPTKKAKIESIVSHKIIEIKDHLPEIRRSRYLKKPEESAFSAYLTISEGRKHQVKLMLAALGCKIIYLKRVSFAGLPLDEALSPGEWRFLRESEISLLSQSAGIPFKSQIDLIN